MTMPSGIGPAPLAERSSRFLSSWFVGVVARVDDVDNRIFPRGDADRPGEAYVGGSGERDGVAVERANDINVIPQ